MRACRLLLLFGLAWGACAQQISIELDPLKSKIEFALGGALHTVHGTFRLKKGRLIFDRRAGAISGQLIADAASGNSGNGLRDRRMHHDILQSDRYPEIVFEPVKFVGSMDSGVTVSGWLSLHGVRREITVPMQVRISDSGCRKLNIYDSRLRLLWGPHS